MENLKISRIKAAGKSITNIAYLSLVSIVLSLIMYFHVSNLNTKDYWKETYSKDGSFMEAELIPAADFKVIYTSYAVVFGIILLIQLINLFSAGFALKNCDLEQTFYKYEYKGELKDGKKHGQGTQTYYNGAKYEGEWMNDMMHGQGTYTYPKTYDGGAKYEGEWMYDKKHGQGTFTYTNGTIKKGLWENGEFVGE